MIHNQWLHRNSVLHNTAVINDLLGKSLLRAAFAEEFERGIDNLPNTFIHHCRGTIDRILTAPMEGQKQWYHLIKLARETTDTDTNFNLFSVNGTLQDWIKLPPKGNS